MCRLVSLQFLILFLLESTESFLNTQIKSSRIQTYCLLHMQGTTKHLWKPLDPESLVAAPCLIEQTLCQPNDDDPQFAKDYQYATAILDAWKVQENADERVWNTEWRRVRYQADHDQPLYGHMVRPTRNNDDKVPAILLFHTGTGPHDLFLLWKAAALVNTLHCVVFIADILGDDVGWAWNSDRSQYNTECQKVLQVIDGARPVLQGRLEAAYTYLRQTEGVDGNRLGALGWCLGGHSILELSRMNLDGIQAMATFHGVFDSLPTPRPDVSTTESTRCEVLICHGVNDPFIPDTMVEHALATLQAGGYRTSLLQVPAKHGFTNPAQDFNPNDAFGFSQEAADKSWKQTIALLRRNLCQIEPHNTAGLDR